MDVSSRFTTAIASGAGLTAVALGALGAHKLRPILEASGHFATWQTAVQYHLVHAVALLALAVAARSRHSGSRSLLWATVAWLIGIVCFSGSLYALSLGGPRWLGPITPAGGLSLLVGWLLAGAAFWRKDDVPPAQ